MDNSSERTYELEKRDSDYISAEIMNYLTLNKSDIFKHNPKDKKTDIVMYVFEEINDSRIKNKFREAVYLCFKYNDIFSLSPDILFNLFVLVDQMRIYNIKMKDFIFQLLFRDNYPKYFEIDKTIFKQRLFRLIIKFDLSFNEFDTLIKSFIQNPDYTENCLIASSKYFPTLDKFVNFFHQSIDVYEVNKDRVDLPKAIRECLILIGKNKWHIEGKKLFDTSPYKLDIIEKLFKKAKLFLIPTLCPFSNDIINISTQFYDFDNDDENNRKVLVATTLEIKDDQKKFIQNLLANEISDEVFGKRKKREIEIEESQNFQPLITIEFINYIETENLRRKMNERY